MTEAAQSIDIFMGAPVEFASERAVLERAYDLAVAAGVDAIILANFTVHGRQIDALIATDAGALLLEAKGALQPIEGDVNGSWRLRTSAGPMPVRNGYLQALGAKNALHDAMNAISAPAPYPDASVVIVPIAAVGSNLTRGDRKARVINLGELALPQRSDATAWSVSQWRALATRHSLQRVSRLTALFDERMLAAEQRLDSYGRIFLGTYGARSAQLFPFPCTVAGEALNSDTLADRFANDSGVILVGPSGCGKSLTGLALAISRLSVGEVPLVVAAKLFDGSLRPGLDRETALLGIAGYATLASDCRHLGRRLVILIDGYNECATDQRFALSRAAAALVRRAGARLIVTSQIQIEGELLQATVVTVPRPPRQLKAEIARAAAMGALSPATGVLLEAVSTGLEARMLGEVGGELPNGASRFALFDLYVRRRLGRQASEGIRTLAEVAGVLAERLSFSLSVRDFDRLPSAADHSSDVLAALFEAGFLERRGDRLSFGHELFLQAFQAEALVRRAKGDADEIVAALGHALFAPSGEMILGAIDDPVLLPQVLASLSNGRLVTQCLSGACGQVARAWAEAQCDRILGVGRAEIEDSVFAISDEAWMGVGPTRVSLRQWSPAERAILAALPDWISHPARLPRLLEVARAADARLAVEHRRLAPEAREKKVALRSGLFGQTYVHTGFGLSNAFGVNAGLRRWDGAVEDLAEIFAARAHDASPGEAHILLELARCTTGIARLIAKHIPSTIERLWPRSPYHLKLELLEVAGHCWQAEDAERQAVVQALEDIGPIDNIMLSTQWIESMEQLGALEADAERELESLRADMPAILAQPRDPDQQRQAWSLYYRRFDHPLSSAYCTVFDELDAAMQLQLLAMAAEVAELDTFFAGPLIVDLARAGEGVVMSPIQRWAILPSPTSMMPLDALGNFLMAHIILARNRLEQPIQPMPAEAAGQALMACADSLYWANRSDLPSQGREVRIATAWREMAVNPGAALVALAECHKVRQEPLHRLPGEGVDPCDILVGREPIAVEFARAVLADGDLMSGWFQPRFFDPTATILFALEVLGGWGDASDLSRLRALTQISKVSEQALAQIRRLEDTLYNPASR